ncbi:MULTISPECIES: exodeoxyribonuclease III [unclassified Undibacterium]|uniref:exodeoxyribonuclease III n=1 Tax=unclassified Undibacterium TaxID=2630295 RepID=UPI002AC97DF1|nr:MULTISPECIES: exodeoxyribonuclease III [unclassified Undibacterium]MEB0139925.1 exodeoxyribonuclease III [Undibacterium sp. CCC2.1]MEB0172898.1 exodeoxyribonuclease III [Undibacterium sp. CCC1.1]MEB0176725.1 exodeoxyribonuclease III [Undibacterium sp. CCC3.4]MEB0216652.1 exodeoxyribonuclease III [Undibacterium sp. 5I2]WPX44964.1 exodeoxyribonuclease III [Undibacterium sp. CCC3.4]
MTKIISANLNGIRSAAKKGFFEWMEQQDADFVCVQELKAQAGDMTADFLTPHGCHGHFHYAEKKGYSGAGVYSKQAPDAVHIGFGSAEFDPEGRYVRCDFGNLSVISVYCPSGSSSPERQEAKFRFMAEFYPHLAMLMAAGRELVICGDWNIAHKEVDLKNWKSNQKNSGFLPEERAWLSRLFDEQGWVDVYRQLHPDLTGEAYTWWSNRGQAWANNVGWRIDYHVATPAMGATARSASVYKEQRFSDHAPLTIVYA